MGKKCKKKVLWRRLSYNGEESENSLENFSGNNNSNENDKNNSNINNINSTNNNNSLPKEFFNKFQNRRKFFVQQRSASSEGGVSLDRKTANNSKNKRQFFQPKFNKEFSKDENVQLNNSNNNYNNNNSKYRNNQNNFNPNNKNFINKNNNNNQNKRKPFRLNTENNNKDSKRNFSPINSDKKRNFNNFSREFKNFNPLNGEKRRNGENFYGNRQFVNFKDREESQETPDFEIRTSQPVQTVFFDNEEYTKIQTPRQEVIFKKGSLEKRRESVDFSPASTCDSPACEEIIASYDHTPTHVANNNGIYNEYKYLNSYEEGIFSGDTENPPLAGVVMQATYPGGPLVSIPVHWTQFLDPGLIPGDTALTTLDPAYTHVINPDEVMLDPGHILPVQHDANGCPVTVQVKINQEGLPIEIEPSTFTVSLSTLDPYQQHMLLNNDLVDVSQMDQSNRNLQPNFLSKNFNTVDSHSLKNIEPIEEIAENTDSILNETENCKEPLKQVPSSAKELDIPKENTATVQKVEENKIGKEVPTDKTIDSLSSALGTGNKLLAKNSNLLTDDTAEINNKLHEVNRPYQQIIILKNEKRNKEMKYEVENKQNENREKVEDKYDEITSDSQYASMSESSSAPATPSSDLSDPSDCPDSGNVTDSRRKKKETTPKIGEIKEKAINPNDSTVKRSRSEETYSKTGHNISLERNPTVEQVRQDSKINSHKSKENCTKKSFVEKVKDISCTEIEKEKKVKRSLFKVENCKTNVDSCLKNRSELKDECKLISKNSVKKCEMLMSGILNPTISPVSNESKPEITAAIEASSGVGDKVNYSFSRETFEAEFNSKDKLVPASYTIENIHEDVSFTIKNNDPNNLMKSLDVDNVSSFTSQHNSDIGDKIFSAKKTNSKINFSPESNVILDNFELLSKGNEKSLTDVVNKLSKSDLRISTGSYLERIPPNDLSDSLPACPPCSPDCTRSKKNKKLKKVNRSQSVESNISSRNSCNSTETLDESKPQSKRTSKKSKKEKKNKDKNDKKKDAIINCDSSIVEPSQLEPSIRQSVDFDSQPSQEIKEKTSDSRQEITSEDRQKIISDSILPQSQDDMNSYENNTTITDIENKSQKGNNAQNDEIDVKDNTDNEHEKLVETDKVNERLVETNETINNEENYENRETETLIHENASSNNEESVVCKKGYIMVPILTPYYDPAVLYGYQPVATETPIPHTYNKKKKNKDKKKANEAYLDPEFYMGEPFVSTPNGYLMPLETAQMCQLHGYPFPQVYPQLIPEESFIPIENTSAYFPTFHPEFVYPRGLFDHSEKIHKGRVFRLHDGERELVEKFLGQSKGSKNKPQKDAPRTENKTDLDSGVSEMGDISKGSTRQNSQTDSITKEVKKKTDKNNRDNSEDSKTADKMQKNKKQKIYKAKKPIMEILEPDFSSSSGSTLVFKEDKKSKNKTKSKNMKISPKLSEEKSVDMKVTELQNCNSEVTVKSGKDLTVTQGTKQRNEKESLEEKNCVVKNKTSKVQKKGKYEKSLENLPSKNITVLSSRKEQIYVDKSVLKEETSPPTVSKPEKADSSVETRLSLEDLKVSKNSKTDSKSSNETKKSKQEKNKRNTENKLTNATDHKSEDKYEILKKDKKYESHKKGDKNYEYESHKKGDKRYESHKKEHKNYDKVCNEEIYISKDLCNKIAENVNSQTDVNRKIDNEKEEIRNIKKGVHPDNKLENFSSEKETVNYMKTQVFDAADKCMEIVANEICYNNEQFDDSTLKKKIFESDEQNKKNSIGKNIGNVVKECVSKNKEETPNSYKNEANILDDMLESTLATTIEDKKSRKTSKNVDIRSEFSTSSTDNISIQSDTANFAITKSSEIEIGYQTCIEDSQIDINDNSDKSILNEERDVVETNLRSNNPLIENFQEIPSSIELCNNINFKVNEQQNAIDNHCLVDKSTNTDDLYHSSSENQLKEAREINVKLAEPILAIIDADTKSDINLKETIDINTMNGNDANNTKGNLNIDETIVIENDIEANSVIIDNFNLGNTNNLANNTESNIINDNSNINEIIDDIIQVNDTHVSILNKPTEAAMVSNKKVEKNENSSNKNKTHTTLGFRDLGVTKAVVQWVEETSMDEVFKIPQLNYESSDYTTDDDDVTDNLANQKALKKSWQPSNCTTQ